MKTRKVTWTKDTYNRMPELIPISKLSPLELQRDSKPFDPLKFFENLPRLFQDQFHAKESN